MRRLPVANNGQMSRTQIAVNCINAEAPNAFRRPRPNLAVAAVSASTKQSVSTVSGKQLFFAGFFSSAASRDTLFSNGWAEFEFAARIDISSVPPASLEIPAGDLF
jgi:hypothetical protein